MTTQYAKFKSIQDAKLTTISQAFEEIAYTVESKGADAKSLRLKSLQTGEHNGEPTYVWTLTYDDAR